MNIVEFLHARYDEIETTAEIPRRLILGPGQDLNVADFIAGPDSEYVLADIASKRRLIDLGFRHAQTIDAEWGCCHDADEIKASECDSTDIDTIELLKLLALPFAGHPDYREEWKLH